jgi:Sec-independent protein translocase protein TatA
MNLGPFGPQLIIFLILALILFGPKQMIGFAFQAGQWLSKFRKMYEETMGQVQAEIKNTGLDEVAKTVKTVVTTDAATLAQNYLNETKPAADSTPTPAPPPDSAVTPPANSETKGKYDSWLPN